MEKRPNSRANLDRAIQRLYGTQTRFVEIRSMIANTIVGQFLPEGVVKGGSALRLRFGLDVTRMTMAEPFLSADILEVFKTLCLEEPRPVPLMPLTHQVAQKLHGVSDVGGSRAHDLVDLQLIYSHGDVDAKEVRRIAERLFANRRRQTWPPTVVKGESWNSLYADAAQNLPVLQKCDDAVAWVSDLITRISRA